MNRSIVRALKPYFRTDSINSAIDAVENIRSEANS